jgi:hypothetical protein
MFKRTNSVYNRKLYGVDKQSGQIYKHSSTQTGFDQGTPWLKNIVICQTLLP